MTENVQAPYPDYIFFGRDLTEEQCQALAALDQAVGQARVDAGLPAVDVKLVAEDHPFYKLLGPTDYPGPGHTLKDPGTFAIVCLLRSERGVPLIEAAIEEIKIAKAAFETMLGVEMDLLNDLPRQEDSDQDLADFMAYDRSLGETLSAMQAASERLIEAAAHLRQTTNTISRHPSLAKGLTYKPTSKE